MEAILRQSTGRSNREAGAGRAETSRGSRQNAHRIFDLICEARKCSDDAGPVNQDDIIRRYRSMRSAQDRELLVDKYIYLVIHCAKKISLLLPGHVDMDDLISEGIIGLLDAIDRFNPERGADFTTYATIRIRGAIIDYLRQEDLIPRKVRDYLREIENARVQLEVEKKRTPTQEEIAERLGITLKKLSHYMKKVRTAEMVSLDELRRLSRFREAKATPLFRREDAELCAELEKNERIAILRNACRNLKPRERLILALYYIEELPLKHMQHILGISMARISQINKRVLSTLRSALEDRKEILIS